MESPAAWNSSKILTAIPKTSSGNLHNCLMYTANNETTTCSNWVYDTTYRTSSRAIEWNLVCDKRWLGALVQSVFMMGVFAGSSLLGWMADKLGRKTIFCFSAILQVFFSIAVAFTPEFWSFLLLRFFYGAFGCAGCYTTAFVLTVELIGTSKRTICGIAFPAAFSVGIILVAVWGAIIDDRQILQLVYGLHSLILIPHIWIMDESPRWLWSQGRIKDAMNIIEKALKYNGNPGIPDRELIISRGKPKLYNKMSTPSSNISDLFKSPALRKRITILCLCWFANSQVYYGLSLSSSKFAGNPYLVIGVMALGDLPSLAFVTYLLNVWGRRPVMVSFMLLGGTACIIATFIQLKTVSTVIVIIGKLFIAGSFATVYNYGAELLPTIVRNSGIGLGATCARLSAAIAPFTTILDSFDPKIPVIIFGLIAIMSGFSCLFLPETMRQPLPETISDGENFGKEDTGLSFFTGKKRNKKKDYVDGDETVIPLNDLKSV